MQRWDFEGDLPIQFFIQRAIDNPHAATTDFIQDPVLAEVVAYDQTRRVQ